MSNKTQTSFTVCAWAAVVIAAMGLLAYIPGLGVLGSVDANYIPMAPSTAVSFLLLGFVLLAFRNRVVPNLRALTLVLLVAVVALFGFLEVAGYFTGLELNFEETLVPAAGDLRGIPIARMSPSTGAAFFVSGVAVFLLLRRRGPHSGNRLNEYVGNGLGMLVFLTSFLVCLAYLYGTPLMYGHGATIPMAVTTALGFLALSVAILTFDRGSFPLALITGPSTRSYLLRWILPITTLSVVVGGFTMLSWPHTSQLNPAVTSAALTVAVALLSGLVASLISRHLGGKIDRSREEAEQANEEVHQLEVELLRARKLESVGILAGGIAHDANNILAGIFGNVELAMMELSEADPAYFYLDTACQALDRATSLTKQLLTFAKGGDPILGAVDLKEEIEHSVGFNLSGSNVKAILNLPDYLWQVQADRGQLSQVIANLTINALQAMPDGGKLYVDGENVEAMGTLDGETASTSQLADAHVKLTIRDEGIGISSADIERVFDPYFSTKPSGSGLGLATVYHILAKHHGHIAVDSELNVGTTFRICVPAATDAVATGEPAPPETPKSPALPGKHVLVMDDEEMIRDVAKIMLEKSGYTCDFAAHGEEALEKYTAASESDRPFELVIMDLTVPGAMGGKETMEKLLADHPDATVVVSSGYSNDAVMANYEAYGFKGRLEKPFRLANLTEVLASIFRA